MTTYKICSSDDFEEYSYLKHEVKGSLGQPPTKEELLLQILFEQEPPTEEELNKW